MPNNIVLDKIRSRGYWQIRILPLHYDKNRIASLGRCKEIIKKAQVSLRGWDYPFFESEALLFEDYIQVDVEFKTQIESWRFYLSGQFVQYLALQEDWLDYQSMIRQDSRFDTLQSGDILGFDLMVYNMTEIFEFISRLAKQMLFTDGVEIEIALHKTANRKLFSFNISRAPFFRDYNTSSESISYTKAISERDASDGAQQNAFDAILFFVDKFGWDRPNIPSIKDMQQNLLERRLGKL